ncbi:MAG TPA: protein kinase [Woeseiaceae bacterium]|nr:protein kinase [Woeseiaceae bacterium]
MRELKAGARAADRYTLKARLGSGGMSEVWLARDQRSASNVALKFLLPEINARPGGRELFHREWQTGTRLMHAHIARVFEYHDDPDGPFYSQQFIGGPDAGVLAERPVAEALRPFGPIADALRYAHGKGIVHRDVKAANILFDGRGAPYLVDFGVAAAASGGTPAAMSPQQRAGAAPGPADDVYALGVLMHETLFGGPPAAESDLRQDLRRPVSRDGAPLPPALQELLAAMLAAEADERPSAEDVARRLRDAGIEPGPIRLRPSEAAFDDGVAAEVESVESARPFRRAALLPAAGEMSGGRGVSAWFLYGGLAVLAVVVVAVFYLLPNALENDRRAAPAPEPVAGEPAATPGEQPPDAAAGPSPEEIEAIKAATDETLGDLLSDLERLKLRAVERWGGPAWQRSQDVYQSGDEAYLDRDYALAGQRYREALELLQPLFGRIEPEFRQAMAAGKAAFEAGNHADAVRLFDLAVAITPGNVPAKQWLERARNLEGVLRLTDQGLRFENDLELLAAKSAFEKALELDPAWQPAAAALERVEGAIRQRSFEQRMTEGFNALAATNYPTARAAFEAAKTLKPDSQQPVDGLLQVEQAVRLAKIRRLESQAKALEDGERWQAAVQKYEEILDIDALLQFAQVGLARSRERAALHAKLESYIAAPDSLSMPAVMQQATDLLLQISRMASVGPRLEDRKDELSRLLKRAATPLTVRFVSDNATQVSIFRVGQLGTFTTQELQLRPGTYVATGHRAGFRDVRLEFRVAPELELEPIVVKCEERI